MARFEFSISIGLVGCQKKKIVEVDDEELEGMTTDEKEKLIDDLLQEWVYSQCSIDWKEIK